MAGRVVSSLRATTKNTIGLRPGSELFPPKGSSYVPLGLSPQEYAKIKADEKEAHEKMNFGMFGPRFAPVDTPNGDWFLTPKLWTFGFQSRSDAPRAVNDDQEPELEPKRPLHRRALLLGRKYSVAFLMCYVLLDMVLAGTLVYRSTGMNPRSTMALLIRLLTWRARHSVAQVALMTAVMLTKVQVVKLAIAATLTLPAQRWIEKINRRRLWSPRRTVLTTLTGGLAMLVVWTSLLLAFR